MTRLEEFVHGFLEHSPEKIDDEVDIFLAWLQENGADEWHRWAISWNWDHGTELFEWIVDQPNCDRGTALSLYYNAQPDFYTRYASVEAIDGIHSESVDLMMRICERWREGAYQTYAYQPVWSVIEVLAQDEKAKLALAAAVPWDVPDDLARTGVQGEPNEFERTIDGVPVEMLRALGEEW
jgi:hypothetical protein